MPAIPGSPSALAAKTARWATTMTRWAIRFSSTGKRPGTNIAKRWQFVGFAGPNGAESRGIVDILAIRRDHRPSSGVLQPGDLFEIVLVQIKGGTAPWPTPADVKRLRAVQRRYRAKAVVLASWQKGTEPTFYVLKRSSPQGRNPWRPTSPVEVFGARRPPSR
jgi:hypothetical protein